MPKILEGVSHIKTLILEGVVRYMFSNLCVVSCFEIAIIFNFVAYYVFSPA